MNKKEYIALLNYQQLSPTVRKGLEQLIEERYKLEKALDKACEILEEYGALTNLYSEDKRTFKGWKEWCLKDE